MRLELPAALEPVRASYRDDISRGVTRVREFFRDSGFELPDGSLIDTAVVFETVDGARESMAREFGIPVEGIPPTFSGTVVDRKLFLVSREAYRDTWRRTYSDWPWSADAYRQLVVHELAHRAHESVAIARLDSAGAMGPAWFFEGLALVCAGQFDSGAAPMKLEEIVREAGEAGSPGESYPRYARMVRSLGAKFGMKALITRAAEPGFPGTLGGR